MDYTTRLEQVSVVGAAGKMGSGIVLLTAMEMADISLLQTNRGRTFVLHAIDTSHSALNGLLDYLRVQVLRNAEKKIVSLRKIYHDRPDLIENHEIIDQYIRDVLLLVKPVTQLEAAFSSSVVFEAVNEDPDLKVKLLSQINENNPGKPFFLTNTSSVPIHELDERARLQGRILGFHFYNPPAVQKLVELITTPKTDQQLINFAREYAGKLGKRLVTSNDIAGFIGNGHFMRDALYGISQAETIAGKLGFAAAIWCMNRVSQEFLLRPMGIFQLIDYVGLDVCRYIMQVMNARIKGEDIHSSLLDTMVVSGISGGQYPDGSQKNGFLRYEKNVITGVYDASNRDYLPLGEVSVIADEYLGPLPGAYIPWKSLIKSPFREEEVKKYFDELSQMTSEGARLAREYHLASKAIGLRLVEQGVAGNAGDVNQVLLSGFYHAYEPINDYL